MGQIKCYSEIGFIRTKNGSFMVHRVIFYRRGYTQPSFLLFWGPNITIVCTVQYSAVQYSTI